MTGTAIEAIRADHAGSLIRPAGLLEARADYDAGGFAPFRFIPKGTIAVPGLMTTKSPELKSADARKARIDEAAKLIPIEQLAISPQCGFASGKSGGQMSIEQQERKLARIAEVAEDVWG